MSLEPGDLVELLRRRRMAPDSILSLQEGDTGTVMQVGLTSCVVDFGGLVAVVPLTDVAEVGTVVWWG